MMNRNESAGTRVLLNYTGCLPNRRDSEEGFNLYEREDQWHSRLINLCIVFYYCLNVLRCKWPVLSVIRMMQFINN